MKPLRLWPDTLFTRMALLIAGLLVLSQLAVYLFFHTVLGSPAAYQARQWTQLLIIAGELSPEQRQALAPRLAARGMILAPAGAVTGTPPRDARLRDVERHMQNTLGPAARVLVDRKTRRVWLEAGPNAPVAVSPDLPTANDLPLPYLRLGAIVLLSLLGGFIAVRQVARPLARLVAGVERVERRQMPESLPVEGPADIRRLAERFNHLLTDLQDLLKERELVLIGVSHDLRTPLTRLRLAAEFLPPSQAEARDEIVANVREMDAIVDQFLSYAREGKDEVLKEGDLNALVAGIADRYRALPKVALTFTPAPLPLLPFQELSLGRAIANLIDNALRHGSGPVEIATEAAPAGARLHVRDHGPGIPADMLTRIREPFVRAGQSGGAGLGLAIAERIARRHGGGLELHNHPEGGLDAVIVLPVPAKPDTPEERALSWHEI